MTTLKIGIASYEEMRGHLSPYMSVWQESIESGRKGVRPTFAG